MCALYRNQSGASQSCRQPQRLALEQCICRNERKRRSTRPWRFAVLDNDQKRVGISEKPKRFGPCSTLLRFLSMRIYRCVHVPAFVHSGCDQAGFTSNCLIFLTPSLASTAKASAPISLAQRWVTTAPPTMVLYLPFNPDFCSTSSSSF